MNIPDNILQNVIDAAFEMQPGRYLDAHSSCAEWEHEAPFRLALAKDFLAAIAQHLAPTGVGEYTDEEISKAGRTAWETTDYAGLPWLRAFLSALPRRASQLGVLRPLAEAGPVPDGCIRVSGYRTQFNDCGWMLGEDASSNDTHFADIRLPAAQPAPAAQPEPSEEVPLGPEDCPPGSVIGDVSGDWFRIKYAKRDLLRFDIEGISPITWEDLKDNGWQINTSLPDIGRWDATAWRKASKKGVAK